MVVGEVCDVLYQEVDSDIKLSCAMKGKVSIQEQALSIMFRAYRSCPRIRSARDTEGKL